MQEYTIDLTLDPEKRWGSVDVSSIADLAEQAKEELDEVLPRWQRTALLAATKMLKHAYGGSEYVREIKGLARMADVSFDELLLLNLSYDLASSGFEYPGMMGCTAALVRDRDITVARTMDWGFPEAIRDHTTLYRFKHEDHEVLTAGFPGFVGVVSGLSSLGLAVTLNQAFPGTLPQMATPVPWLVRDVLMYTSTYKEAVKLITTTPAASGGFYVITDGLRGAIIESTGRDDTVYELEEKYAVVANHYTYDDPEECEREWGDTFERQEVLERSLREGMPQSVALTQEPVEHAATAHQMVINPRQRTMKIRCPNGAGTWSIHKCPSN
jgi:acid ceramidase